MGVKITELLEGHETAIEELKGKIVAVDAFNMLYQFLTTIRARDGTPLTDSKGRVTSHLIGLFSRTTNLMVQGIKLVFVFDGEAPELKKKERERRKAVKEGAQEKFDAARAAENVDEMRKYAGRTARLTGEMIDQAKALLTALGLPVVQAPSEGEAQAAHLVAKGDAYAVVSQDADAFLFGAPRVIRNLAITGRKKQRSALAYEKVSPERFELAETLHTLGLTREELIALAMLVGTDYDIGGVRGIGPKKAMKLIKEYSSETHNNKKLEELFAAVKWEEYQEADWRDVYKLFLEMPVTDDYELAWKAPDEEAVIALLVDEHEFSRDRVTSALEKISAADTGQKGLNEFFG